MKIRVVFDCYVYLQAAARQQGAAAGCLQHVEDGRVQLYLSDPILREVADVLNRPSIREHFPQWTDDIVDAFVLRLRKLASVVANVPNSAMIAIPKMSRISI